MTKLHHATHFVGAASSKPADFYNRQALHCLRQAKAFIASAEASATGSTGKARGSVGLAILELERKSGADEEE